MFAPLRVLRLENYIKRDGTERNVACVISSRVGSLDSSGQFRWKRRAKTNILKWGKKNAKS